MTVAYRGSKTKRFRMQNLSVACTDGSGYSVPSVFTLLWYRMLKLGGRPDVVMEVGLEKYEQGVRESASALCLGSTGEAGRC